MAPFDYLSDPKEIERESFARIAALTRLDGFDPEQRQIAMRLVHTCGDPGIVDSLAFSPGAVAKGIEGMATGANILCDVEMLRHGLSRAHCRGEKLCFLNSTGVAERASAAGRTRSMMAVEEWNHDLEDGIAAIGNAPTALFRLLELLAEGFSRPRLIVAMPVGFVGALESKQALIDLAPSLGIDYITLQGRSGGSALTAAALNALGRLADGIRF